MSMSFTSRKALLGLACLVAQASAFWRLPCGSPLIVERSDPIVNPGVPSGHSHTIMGANSFNFTMEGDFTSRATCTTCKVKEDMSNYWFPNLYFQGKDGSFTAVKQTGGALVYYLQRQDKKDPEYSKGLIAFPEGFRMLAGTPSLRSYSNTLEQRAVNYVCLGTNEPHANNMPNVNCPGGLRSQIVFPSCWDGKNLDSANHKSHVAYPSAMDNGFCPPTHPKRFITIFVEVVWQVDAFKDMWPTAGKNPFVFSNGDPTGYGFHGDFVNGWDVDVLQKAITTCTDPSGVIEYCKAFTLLPDSGMNTCKRLAHIDEEILGSNMKSLPGCNPVQAGPQAASPPGSCKAPGTIPPQPIPPFANVKPTKNWRFVTCGLDGNGLPGRTLSGASYANNNNTVENCVDFCQKKGFRFAGVEYSAECFCGNTIPKDRMPKQGSLGSCNMPCSGNKKQMCGGSGQIGIYENCRLVNGTCTNMALSQWQ
ncbi:WSC domain-containing protein [Microdochium bolleyi]|uniref:WSC domain-containing protein n=1 Tax=Microdochium bolleyi TaxID=196109 RepID=A0A136JD13_9PEZI|nr:WSC domain-containing protein [Microdochium bolleyi]